MTSASPRQSSAVRKSATYARARRPSSILKRELRARAGRWLCELRKKRDLTQRELAQILGSAYTFVSQIETGRCRLPAERYLGWANALGMNPREFVQELLQYYDPVTHNVLSADLAVRAPTDVALRQNAGAQGAASPTIDYVKPAADPH